MPKTQDEKREFYIASLKDWLKDGDDEEMKIGCLYAVASLELAKLTSGNCIRENPGPLDAASILRDIAAEYFRRQTALPPFPKEI